MNRLLGLKPHQFFAQHQKTPQFHDGVGVLMGQSQNRAGEEEPKAHVLKLLGSIENMPALSM